MLLRPRHPLALLTSSALAAATLAASPTAGAGTTSYDAPTARAANAWTVVSSGSVSSLSEISTARTGDGVVHAFYRQEGAGSAHIEHAALTPGGAAASRSVVAALGSVTSVHPAMVTPGGGLRVVFAGLGSGPAGDGRAVDAVSDASGAAWAVQPRALLKNTSAYAGYGLGATMLANGTPVTASATFGSNAWRVGAIETTDPAARNTAPDDQLTTLPTCCTYDTTLVSSADTVWMAWYQNGDSESDNGVFAQQVHPTAGPVVKAPGSSIGSSSSAPDQSIAMVARPGGGVVMAYRRGYLDASVGLWQVGTTTSAVVQGSKGVDRVSLSATPTGRLWLGWTDDSGDVHVTRTATSGFVTGAPGEVGAPSGSTVWDFAINGSDKDAVVLVNDSATGRVLATVVPPPLTESASRKGIKAGRTTKVAFKVTDGGKGVKGAKVAGGGRKCTTSAKGVCSLALTPRKPGKLKVTAKKRGYGTVTFVLKVKR